MPGHIPAALMAREATRRKLTEPQRELRPRRPRSAAARILQVAAHRLDPGVTAPPRLGLHRG
jgi:hypothetical protein